VQHQLAIAELIFSNVSIFLVRASLSKTASKMISEMTHLYKSIFRGGFTRNAPIFSANWIEPSQEIDL
jgi:hypothetical protein